MNTAKARHLLITLLNSILPVACAFIIGAIIILATRQNPWLVYRTLLGQTLFNSSGFLNTLHFASPLILTGLAIAVTFKAGIYNMGVEGQMQVGAFFAAVAGVSIQGLPSIIDIPLCLAIGIVCGMLAAVVPAILKAYFHVDEMVVTLMLNYAIIEILQVLTQTAFRDPKAGYITTKTILPAAMFKKLGGSSLTLFFPVAILVFIIMYVVFKRSVLGFEITAIGKSPEFAEASGMSVSRKIMTIMLISGALSGLAGAGFLLSEKNSYDLNFSGSPGLGWDGMLIALLGALEPLGILIAAIFYAALETGSDSIAVFTNVPKEIVFILQGLIILFLAVRFLDRNTHFLRRWQVKLPRLR
ncbi:MAG: ABC transporter permease, partial [Micrococcales bacterium]|nr:ABC transporter permease [Micrococcales bacterium]